MEVLLRCAGRVSHRCELAVWQHLHAESLSPAPRMPLQGTAGRERKTNAVAKEMKLSLKDRGLNGVDDSLPC